LIGLFEIIVTDERFEIFLSLGCSGIF